MQILSGMKPLTEYNGVWAALLKFGILRIPGIKSVKSLSLSLNLQYIFGLTAEYPATPKHIWNMWLRGYGATRLGSLATRPGS